MNDNEPQPEATEPVREPKHSAAGSVPDAPPVAPPAGTGQQATGQWVYVQAGPVKPPASGYRIAAGILLIVLGLVETFSYNWLVFLSILGWAPIVVGIVLLCQTRSKKRGTPTLGMWLASFAVALGAFAWLPVLPDEVTGMLFLALAIPILILLNKDWVQEKKSAAPEPELTPR